MQHNSFHALNGKGLRIAIVASRFNQELTDGLVEDCLTGLESCEIPRTEVKVVRVPGAFELPIAVATLLDQGAFDAIVALGVLIKGETKHDEYIANAVSHGLIQISIETKKPVLFGVITANSIEQAQARCLGGQRKGWEVAYAAIETIQALT